MVLPLLLLCRSDLCHLRCYFIGENKLYDYGASLVAQWLRVRLLTQGTRVRAPVPEDPTCRGVAGPVSHGR